MSSNGGSVQFDSVRACNKYCSEKPNKNDEANNKNGKNPPEKKTAITQYFV